MTTHRSVEGVSSEAKWAIGVLLTILTIGLSAWSYSASTTTHQSDRDADMNTRVGRVEGAYESINKRLDSSEQWQRRMDEHQQRIEEQQQRIEDSLDKLPRRMMNQAFAPARSPKRSLPAPANADVPAPVGGRAFEGDVSYWVNNPLHRKQVR